jgi:hypothetical protein
MPVLTGNGRNKTVAELVRMQNPVRILKNPATWESFVRLYLVDSSQKKGCDQQITALKMLKFLMRKMGFEPTRVSSHAPQA